eukprot:SAG31_NODE_4520_length_3170_cov_2.797134_1_plen_38_part_00
MTVLILKLVSNEERDEEGGLFQLMGRLLANLTKGRWI